MKKKFVPVRGKLPAYHQIKSLGEEVMLGIEARLLDGESAAKVVTWLQKDMELLTEAVPASLKKTLERYRGKELRDKTIKKIAQAQRGVSLKEVAKHFNAMAQLEEVAVMQRKRVDKMMELEKGKPMILKAASDEIRLLKDTLVALADMQLDTGLLTRAGKGANGTPVDQMATAQMFTWDDARQKMFEDLKNEYGKSEAA